MRQMGAWIPPTGMGTFGGTYMGVPGLAGGRYSQHNKGYS